MALDITKEQPASKKYDSGGSGSGPKPAASGLTQLLTSTHSKDGEQDSPRTGAVGTHSPANRGGGAFGFSGPKLADADVNNNNEDDTDAPVVFGVDMPFTCKVYLPCYQPPPEPTASPPPAATASGVNTKLTSSGGGGTAAAAAAVDTKSSPAGTAPPGTTAGVRKDRLAIEPGMFVVHITTDTAPTTLVTLILTNCFKQPTTPGTPNSSNSAASGGASDPPPKDFKTMIANTVLCPCDDRGARDDECPPLDAGRFVHQFGVHHFLLKPLRSAPAHIQQAIACLKPAAGGPGINEPLWCGPTPPKNKKGRILMPDPNSRLLMAVETGKLSQVRALVEHAFADVNSLGIDNFTPLHFASRSGHLPIVNYLLKQGGAYDATTKNKWTPLHLAVDRKQLEIAEVLLTVGADPNLKDTHGHTPGWYADQNKHREMLELLNEFNGQIL